MVDVGGGSRREGRSARLHERARKTIELEGARAWSRVMRSKRRQLWRQRESEGTYSLGETDGLAHDLRELADLGRSGISHLEDGTDSEGFLGRGKDTGGDVHDRLEIDGIER